MEFVGSHSGQCWASALPVVGCKESNHPCVTVVRTSFIHHGWPWNGGREGPERCRKFERGKKRAHWGMGTVPGREEMLCSGRQFPSTGGRKGKWQESEIVEQESCFQYVETETRIHSAESIQGLPCERQWPEGSMVNGGMRGLTSRQNGWFGLWLFQLLLLVFSYKQC